MNRMLSQCSDYDRDQQICHEKGSGVHDLLVNLPLHVGVRVLVKVLSK